MGVYSRILLVVDLSDDSEKIGERARALAAACGAELSLLHVVEYVPVEPMGETLLPAVQIEEELVARARERLAVLASRLGLESAHREVASGNIKAEIVRVAQEQHIDLIVLGSRERHGLSIMVNFTEDTVLHAAPCDVLAVRLRCPAPLPPLRKRRTCQRPAITSRSTSTPASSRTSRVRARGASCSPTRSPSATRARCPPGC